MCGATGANIFKYISVASFHSGLPAAPASRALYISFSSSINVEMIVLNSKFSKSLVTRRSVWWTRRRRVRLVPSEAGSGVRRLESSESVNKAQARRSQRDVPSIPLLFHGPPSCQRYANIK